MSDNPDLRLIGRLLDEMRDLKLRVTNLETRFGTIEARLGGLEARFTGMEARFAAQEERMSAMLAILVRLAERIDREPAP